jgi:hypothetical protein
MGAKVQALGPSSNDSGIYHAVIHDGQVQRQDGTVIDDLDTPLDAASGDLVYDPVTDGDAWIHDIEVRGDVPTCLRDVPDRRGSYLPLCPLERRRLGRRADHDRGAVVQR